MIANMYRQLNVNPAHPDNPRSISNMQQTLNGFVKGGTVTTVAGITQTISIDGASENDILITQLVTMGASGASIKTAGAQNGTISITFNVDPGTDHVFSWLLFKLT